MDGYLHAFDTKRVDYTTILGQATIQSKMKVYLWSMRLSRQARGAQVEAELNLAFLQ
jgi:hypothetical protein